MRFSGTLRISLPRFRRRWIGLCLLVLCSSRSALGAPLTIVYGDEYRPFAWEERGQIRGVQPDFVEKILGEKMGIEVVHLPYPWKRGQLLVKMGARDGFFTVSTPERAAYTQATRQPFYTTRFLLHTARGNPVLERLRKVRSLADLAAMTDLRHIYMFGSGWHEHALQQMKSVHHVANAAAIPLMLINGRADVYIEQAEMLHYQATQRGLEKQLVTLQQPVIHELGWRLFIGNSSPHVSLLADIDRTLQALHESGELEEIRREIFARYGIDHIPGVEAEVAPEAAAPVPQPMPD